MRYRMKPVEVEARLLSGDWADLCEIAGWCGSLIQHGRGATWLVIDTPEGAMAVDYGDWIIRNAKGEFCPCKPDVFEATYEPVQEDS